MLSSYCVLLLSLSLIECVPLTKDYNYLAEPRNTYSLDPFLVARITEFASLFGYVNDFEIVKNIERVSDALNFYLTKDVPYEGIFYSLLNPFQITRLHCGPYDLFKLNDNPNVSLDVCLAGLVLAKLFLAAPLLQEGIKEGGIFNVLDTITSTLDRLDFEEGPKLKEGGVFNILDSISNNIARIDLSGSGPEGEPFVSEEKEMKPEIKEIDGLEYEVVSTVQKPVAPPMSEYTSLEPQSNLDDFHASPEDIYQGFGFNDWSSGLKKLTELGTMLIGHQSRSSDLPDFAESNDLELYDYLPRSMPGLPTARLQELLQSTIGGLKAAVTKDN